MNKPRGMGRSHHNGRATQGSPAVQQPEYCMPNTDHREKLDYPIKTLAHMQNTPDTGGARATPGGTWTLPQLMCPLGV